MLHPCAAGMLRLVTAIKKEYQGSSRVTNEQPQMRKAELVARLFFAIVLRSFAYPRYASVGFGRFQTRPYIRKRGGIVEDTVLFRTKIEHGPPA
jgi:hypothetical protein